MSLCGYPFNFISALHAPIATVAAHTIPAGPIAPIDILSDHRSAMQSVNLFMAHRCGFMENVLNATLDAARL